jgi:cytosine/adenosine deaminase-related metal-dependent hydrolase
LPSAIVCAGVLPAGEEGEEEERGFMDLVARVQRGWGQGNPLLTLGVAIRTPAANPGGVMPVSVLLEEWAGARQLGLPITIHARPGAVALLEQHGLLGPDVQLVHPQGNTPEEIRILTARRPSFSTAPMIEMHYAQAARGVIQFAELQEAGLQQSLSIDSSAASANADFFNVMRALMWSHKQRFGAPACRCRPAACWSWRRSTARATSSSTTKRAR